jgi:RNA-binding protein
MTLTSKQRAELRAEAHHLSVTVHIGHQGVTEALRKTLDEAFANRELVKVQFSKNAGMTPKEAANDLAALVDAEVVQAIGRTATLFRAKPEPAKA